MIDALDLSIQGFPEITGHLALSRDLDTAAFNDDPRAWCTQGPSLNADNQQCDRCTLSPCEAPSGISCMGDTLRRSEVTCSIQSGQIENTCTVENVDRACAPGVCLDNQCVRTPDEGELVISEIMVNPEGVREDLGEWIEVYNPQSDGLNLDGCTLSDRAFTTTIQDVVVSPGAYAVFARNLIPGENGGITAVGTFDFALNNGGDRIEIQCGDVLIDALDYGVEGFGTEPGSSLNLDPAQLDAEGNDVGSIGAMASRSITMVLTEAALENPMRTVDAVIQIPAPPHLHHNVRVPTSSTSPWSAPARQTETTSNATMRLSCESAQRVSNAMTDIVDLS